MAMEITKTFTINAPPAAVWAFLIDPQRVARCLPGAAIGEKLDDKTYTGTMTVKVGPVSSSYKGKVTFERLDASTRTAEIRATGQDIRGKGGADLNLTSSLREVAPGKTEVTAVSQVNITGLLAQMGRGMVQDVSDQIFQIFSERMRGELETTPPRPRRGRPRLRHRQRALRQRWTSWRWEAPPRDGPPVDWCAVLPSGRPSLSSSLCCGSFFSAKRARESLRRRHDPGCLRLPRTQHPLRGGGAAHEIWRRRQGALRRPEPAPAAQASARTGEPPGGHRPHPRPRVHQGGGGHAAHRRPHPRIGARALRAHRQALPHPPRHRAR